MSVYRELETLRIKADAYQEAALFWKKAHDVLQQAHVSALDEYQRRLQHYSGIEAALESAITELEEMRARFEALNRALGVAGHA